MKITVLHDKKLTEVAKVELSEDATVDDLNRELTKITKMPKIRQRIVFDGKPLLFGKKIRDFVAAEEFEVKLKDLGPQLPYKVLFVLEYLGPVLTIPLGYLVSKNRSDTAKYGALLGLVHFLKRELESQFVHVFSNQGVPVSGSFKNFFHYWLLFGLIVVGDVFFFKTKASDWPKQYYWAFSALILFFEFMNFKCHVVLRNLRVQDSAVDHHKRGVPKGWGFDSVHCANYTWEILVWLTYTVMTKSVASGAFTLAGIYQMALWAQKKKKLLLDSIQNDDELKAQLAKKKVLFPGLF